jgi:hypothetical protein
MMSKVKELAFLALAVIVGLMVYNAFIAGSSWFGHFEGSNNFEVDDAGNIYKSA